MRKILVVDDEEMVREAVGPLLRREGYDVETAASGEEGVEAVRRASRHLVLLDLRMEGIGGMEALRRMKAHDPGLPVVIITGHADVEGAKEALNSGAEDFLSKPVEPLRLLAVVQRFLRAPLSGAPAEVLVVDDDPLVLRSLLAPLERAGIPAKGFTRGDEALSAASRGEGRVLLTDLRLADTDGLRVIARAREARPGIVSILLTGYPSVETTVEAMRLGALDYLPKPVPPDRLLEAVRKALEKSTLENLPGGLRPGRAYRVEEEERADKLFAALLSRGLPGMRISRDHREERPGPGLAHLRLGLGGGPGSPSVSGPEQLVLAVEEFCRRGRGAVLLEGLEYLSVHSNFETLYRTLALLRDIASASGSVLLVTYPPSAFTEQERTLLAREMEPLDGDGKPGVWEAAASGLAGDEKTLHDILRVAGGQKHQADLVAATGFSGARVSRLLDRMERNGLLRRQRDGMGNLVVLA